MFNWQKVKDNNYNMRKVWTFYVLVNMLYIAWNNQFSTVQLWLLAGTLFLALVSYAFIKGQLDRMEEKKFRYIEYLDLFFLLLALSATNWTFHLEFILYLYIMKVVLSFGMKQGVIYALVASFSNGLLLSIFHVGQWNNTLLVHLLFNFGGIFSTVLVSGFLKEQIKEVEEANVKLVLRNSELFLLQQISNHVTSVLNINDLLNLIPDILIGISGAEYASIYLTEDGTFAGLKLKATNCEDKVVTTELFTGLCGYRIRETFLNGEPTIENSINCGEFGSIMNVPIKHKDQLLGVLVMTHYRPNTFTSNNLQLLMPVASQLAVAIANARLYEQVKRMANVDGLTGVYNRKYFQDQLAKIIDNSDYQDLTVIMFDVDHFKKVNDTYGHLMGDHVLKVMTEVVNRAVNDEGIVARYGGEEFVVLLPNHTMEQGYQMAERLRKLVFSQQIYYQNQCCQITISLGVAGLEIPEVNTLDALLKAADESLYSAKNMGRNRTVRADKILSSKNGVS